MQSQQRSNTNSRSSRGTKSIISGSTSQSPNRKKMRGNPTASALASQNTRKSMKQPIQKEEAISKKILDLYKDREQKRFQAINQTIWDDKLKVYKMFRKEQEQRIHELEKERSKITRRKRNKKEKQRALRKNTVDKLAIICLMLKQTFQHYKKQYYENDHYRQIKLIEIIADSQAAPAKGKKSKHQPQRTTSSSQISEVKEKSESAAEDNILSQGSGRPTVSPGGQDFGATPSRSSNATQVIPMGISQKKFVQQLTRFFDSPFKEDKKFAVQYVAQLTRDRISESEDVVNQLFYDRIFNVLMNSKDEVNRHKSFETLCNMVQSETQRHKLADQQYFIRVFEKMSHVADSKETADTRILEKLSWLATLISFQQDMFDHIIRLNLLQFVLKISDKKYSSAIRSNAVLAISLLTYNENLFDEIIRQGVIDLIMALCRDQDQELLVKQFSTLALVHFALNKKSISILIDKGVLDLFDTFGNNPKDSNNVIIQTNVSWIFLALCNNGITGKKMLTQGITRDMFLVSCNPDYQQIRHLVITGFAELGRCSEKPKALDMYSIEKQRIKETAIVGMHQHLVANAQENIDILLNFSVSKNLKFQYTAFWALKDYILLTHDNLIPDISDIIHAFLIGVLSVEQRVQAECANAISFMVTHHLVYDSNFKNKDYTEKQQEEIIAKIKSSGISHILDAIMYLSGNDSVFIRTTAFSTLSSLSKYSSQCPSVMAQIKRDIEIPEEMTSKNYLAFIETRLSQQREVFEKMKSKKYIETKYSGLYSLLRLGQDPCDEEIEDATNKYIQFIELQYNPENNIHVLNENYFIKVFMALKHTHNPRILRKLLRVIKFYINQDDSKFQADIINPHTILWMLEIMEHQRNEKYLCCLTSSTLLSIVSKHEIHFDYQEVAIIKKFNLALQNIDVFETAQDVEDPQSENSVSDAQTPGGKTGNSDSSPGTRKSIKRKKKNMITPKKPKRSNAPSAPNDFSEVVDSTPPPDVTGGDQSAKYSQMDPDIQAIVSENEIQHSKTAQGTELKQGLEDNDSQSSPSRNQAQQQVVATEESKVRNMSTFQKETNRMNEVDDLQDDTQEGIPQVTSSKEDEPAHTYAPEDSENLSPQPRIPALQSTGGKVAEEKLPTIQSVGDIPDHSQLEKRQSPSIRSIKGSSQQVNKISERPSDNQLSAPVQQEGITEKPSSKSLGVKTQLEAIKSESSQPSESMKQHPHQQYQSEQLAETIEERGSGSPAYLHQDTEAAKSANTAMKVLETDPATGQKSSMTNSAMMNNKLLQRSSTRKITLFAHGAKQTTNSTKFQKMSSQGDPDYVEESRQEQEEDKQSMDTEQIENVDIENIDPSDHELVDQHLRDSLIKAFMVIFTNEQSQHLLLNKDLIDIAFNCLEFCNECTLSAKRHVSRLISIIFKFPQVQERLMASEVVNGICELLRQTKHSDIVRHTIKACTYISMNYEFIKKSELSLDILKSMMQLLDTMKTRDDQYNIILTIKNILKGDNENRLYFFENQGTVKFADIVLNSGDLQLIEMCIQGIQEIASFKKIVIMILKTSKTTRVIKNIIKRCLELTDDWHHDASIEIETTKRPGHGRSKHSDPSSVENSAHKPSASPTQESKFSYSIDDSNVQIPEFMKNDLDMLNLEGNEGELKIEEGFKVTRHGKIRNSIYFVVARAIKFGLDINFLLKDCSLITRIIKDLSLQNENNFIFQNLLLIISNLKLEKKAIVDLIGNNYETIIEQIFEIKDKDRRVSLLKVLINLVLEASEELSGNYHLFKRIFDICRDPRSDDSMIENCLWLATSLCEQSLFNKNFSNILDSMIRNSILDIIFQSLQSKEERILLQSLKLLTKLADHKEIFQTLDKNKTRFSLLELIPRDIIILLNKLATSQYQTYQMEIQTALCRCLDKLTRVDKDQQHGPQILMMESVDEIKEFNKYLISLALLKDYKVRRLDSEPSLPPESSRNIPYPNPEDGTRTNQNPTGQTAQSNNLDNNRQFTSAEDGKSGENFLQAGVLKFLNADSAEMQNPQFNEPVQDDIERISDSNEMIENILFTLSNISSDPGMHEELISNGILEVIKRYVELFLGEAKAMNKGGVNEQEEGLQLNILPTGQLRLIKVVSTIIMNISSNQQVHVMCAQKGFLSHMISCLKLLDYQVTTNIYKSIGNMLVSPHQDIRRKAMYENCLQEMLQAHENSEFFRIKRICAEYLNQVAGMDPQMFEINDLFQEKQRQSLKDKTRQEYLNLESELGSMMNETPQQFVQHQQSKHS